MLTHGEQTRNESYRRETVNAHNLRIFALVCAENAKLEAMKAANADCAARDCTPEFLEPAFFSIAEELARLAESVAGEE